MKTQIRQGALTLIFGAAALVCATSASAQSAKTILQSVITQQGKSCPQVTAVRGFATTENGEPLIAAACSNGDRHVVKLDDDDQPVYMFTCATMQSFSDIKCFGDRP